MTSQATNYDVVVIGAGITGAGVAQAAAAAGYRVLVLESGSVGGGTSCKSSKLIHGGLRYLESMQFSLVRESLLERELLLKLAPELVHLIPLHIPVYQNSSRAPWKIRAGLSLYRMLSGLASDTTFSTLPRSGWDQLDGLRTDQLKAIFRYQEAQTDDQALTRAVVASACSLGAELLAPATFTHGEVHATGCEIHYKYNNREDSCRARVLVNCAGPWAPEVAQQITPRPQLPQVDLIGGSHLLLPPVLKQHYYLESPSDQRAVFALPWQGRLLVGTTETPHTGKPEQVECHPHEMHYLLAVLRHYFPEHHLLPSSAEPFAGLRVLPHSSQSAFGRSRDVMICRDQPACPRVVTIMGGKLTTYRATAEQIVKCLYPSLPVANPKADTKTLPLHPCDSIG